MRAGWYMYKDYYILYVCVCVCVYIYIYIYIEREREKERESRLRSLMAVRGSWGGWERSGIFTHTHTHTHMYMYIYIYVAMYSSLIQGMSVGWNAWTYEYRLVCGMGIGLYICSYVRLIICLRNRVSVGMYFCVRMWVCVWEREREKVCVCVCVCVRVLSHLSSRVVFQREAWFSFCYECFLISIFMVCFFWHCNRSLLTLQ